MTPIPSRVAECTWIPGGDGVRDNLLNTRIRDRARAEKPYNVGDQNEIDIPLECWLIERISRNGSDPRVQTAQLGDQQFPFSYTRMVDIRIQM